MQNMCSAARGVYMSKWVTLFPRIYQWKLIMNPIYWIVLCLIIGPFMMILGGVDYAKYKQATKNLDSEMYGEVVNVEFEENSLDVSDREYIATVRPTDWKVFNVSLLTSGKTKYAYKTGEIVEIYYDSSNLSEYRIEHNAPTNGAIPLLVIGSVMTCLGLFIFAGNRVWKKLGS